MADDLEDIIVEMEPDDGMEGQEPLEVPLGEGEAELAPLEYGEDDENLVPTFSEHPDGVEFLQKLVTKLTRDHEAAWESCEEARDRRAKEWSFFAAALPKKEFPFENCANGHVPILLENMLRIYTRAYGELFGDWSAVCGYVATSPRFEGDAAILAAHTNWQLREGIPNFRNEQHLGMLQFFLHGDVIARSFYDFDEEHNVHEMLELDSFSMPYARTSTHHDFRDLPYYTLRMSLYEYELERRIGEWHNVEEVIAKQRPTYLAEEGEPLAEANIETTGIAPPDDDEGAPYEIILYEGWIKLPLQDRHRWCQAHFDKRTQTILSLRIHEEPDWRDEERWRRQMGELTEFRRAQAARAMMAQAAQQVGVANQMAAMEAESMVQQHEGDAAAQVATGMADPTLASEQVDAIAAAEAPPMVPPPELPPEPVPPDWMRDPNDPEEEPEPYKRVPVRLFCRGTAVPSLRGNLGVSYGTVLYHQNLGANVALNQFIDAATLGNVGMHIAAPGVDFETPFAVRPGRVARVKTMNGTSLKDALLPLSFKEGNPQLVQLVQMFSQWAQSAMQSPGVLSGDPGKSGETYRGIAARIEQATKQLSVTTRRYADFFEQILRNNARLNARFLREDEFLAISGDVAEASVASVPMGPQGPMVPPTPPPRVTRGMYATGYRIVVRSDLRFATTSQKISEADEMQARIAGDPLLQANFAIQYAVRRRMLEARDRRDLIALMGPQPPPATSFPAMPPQPMMPPGGAPPQQ